MKYFITICIFFFVCLGNTYSQKKESIEQKAHNKKIKIEEFTLTENAKFKIKVFTVGKKSMVNKTHHWFVQLLSLENTFLNYADVEVKGHLKSDPNIPFKFMNPVMKLCSEGKYIIGFTKVKQAGIYELQIEIENDGEQDKAMIEIEIPEKMDESIN